MIYGDTVMAPRGMFGSAARPRGIFAPPERPGYATPGLGEGVTNGPLGPDLNAALASNSLVASAPMASNDGAHYAMHGRGPDGMFGRKKRGTLEKVLRGLGTFALHYQAGQGDPAAQMAIRDRMARRQGRDNAEAEFGEHHSLVRNLMARGISPEDAELYALNPKALSEEFATQLRTRDMAPGHTIRTPGLGTQPESIWTAPKIVEDGPNQVQLDPNTGEARTLYQGKTPAQWAAEESGFPLNSDAARRFMQDFHLDGQGPTAVQMNRDRLGVTQRGQDIASDDRRFGVTTRDATNRRGQDLRDTTARRGQDVRDTTQRRGQDLRSQLRGRRVGGVPISANEPMAKDAKGNPLVVRNGKWVPAK